MIPSGLFILATFALFMGNDNISSIFTIKNDADFEAVALKTFQFQYKHNKIYQQFCNHLKRLPSTIHKLEDIPFLPISFFKTHRNVSSKKQPEITFSSSGTTGSVTSKHHLIDKELYERSFLKAFELFYGSIEELCILALLPSYLERDGSSLVYMANTLIKKSGHADSGFYLYDFEKLHGKLLELEKKQTKTLLMGVSFALLDFVERFPLSLSHCMVMETGGMKGRKKEITREELHYLLKKGFGVNSIHSEYGMTELLSQAYSKGNGRFLAPPWMKTLIRDTEDPLHLLGSGKTGGINIIDLANKYSCSFIATQDLGKTYEDGRFEVLGRFDHSDVRGCNLMAL